MITYNNILHACNVITAYLVLFDLFLVCIILPLAVIMYGMIKLNVYFKKNKN